MQLLGSSLFTVNYLMLGAVMGGLMNILAVVRAVLFVNKERWRLNDKLLIGGLTVAFIATYVLEFTVLGVTPTARNLIIEALPVIGMISVTVSFNMTGARTVRLMSITLNSPAWLVYNIYSGSIGAILCEVFSLVSLAIGIIRHDIKRKNKEDPSVATESGSESSEINRKDVE